ncbi:hypothetical protein D9M71_457920 [compost metagenome]
MIEIDMIDVHPGAGQLYFVARLQVAKAAQACQQPAHGQGRRGFHAQDVVLAAQGVASPLQCRKAFAHSRQEQTRRFAELQAAAVAHEQTASEVLLKGADMPADRALGD